MRNACPVIYTTCNMPVYCDSAAAKAKRKCALNGQQAGEGGSSLSGDTSM